ncbi:MAG: aminotransferase class I/II-fold pyridoxal phosphate-dependent enzyme [Patescibacteria group bacterium]
MARIVLATRMATMDESATLALNARAKQLAHEGKTIYNLTAGELASDTPEYIQEAVAKTLQLNKYTPVAGLPQLRQQIAYEARKNYGLDWIEPANVVVTAGAKPALHASLLAIINEGDEVIVPTPAWVSYNHLIELAGGVVIEVPLTSDFDLDPAAIKAELTSRTKAIIINSPHNPTGAIFSTLALVELAATLKGRGVTVISDDMYAKLVYDDSFTLVPTCGFEQLIIINGFSKSQALTGWRIGYAIAEQPIAQAITNLLSHITGNAAVPSQQAAIAAMERHDTPPQETIDALKRQRLMVGNVLKTANKLKYHLPGGAFYVFLDLRAVTDDSAGWCEDLLNETGVALVPGEAFSAAGSARLSFVTDETTLKTALDLIVQFASRGSAGAKS